MKKNNKIIEIRVKNNNFVQYVIHPRINNNKMGVVHLIYFT